MDYSCALATAMDTPGHVAVAEKLGYTRAWLYDTPQQSPDVWMTLTRAALATEQIGLGPGVLVPSLRHPLVNAAATATLAALAPGRVAIAFGTGFTGRRAMGQSPLPWVQVSRYVRVFRALLRGETVEWEGAPIRMFDELNRLNEAARDVPILISAMGPKGEATAEKLGVDGVMSFGLVTTAFQRFDWSALLFGGTILREGESPDSDRVKASAGPNWAVLYHIVMDLMGGPAAVRQMPGGPEWLDHVLATAERERHLVVHDGHLVRLNEADERAWQAGGNITLPQVTLTGSPGEIRGRIEQYAKAGVTEVGFQPCGDDIPGELESFFNAVQGHS
jgi:5,10-methylenetetrahydromethanopterin reductase